MTTTRPARLAGLLFGLCGSIAVAQTTAPAESDETKIRDLQVVNREKVVRQLESSPRLADAPLADVVRLSLAGGVIHVHTRIRPTSLQNRLAVTDLPGLCTLTTRILGGGQTTGEYAPDFFLFVRYQYDVPGTVERATTVEVLPDNLQIDQESETLTTMTQVLLQQHYTRPGRPARVELRYSVDRQGDADGVPATDRDAADLTDLRRKFPADVCDFVEPVLLQMHAAQTLLPADDIAARQIFNLPPTPQVSAAVTPLLVGLDAEDQHARDAAQKRLADLGNPAVLALLRLDRDKLSAEQNARIDQLCAAARPLSSDQIKKLSADLAFVTDCLNDPDEAVVKAAMAAVSKLVGHPIEFDPGPTGDTRRAAVERLTESLKPFRR